MARPNPGGGVPAWMVTFADLMALMMTFFVLLYSFSSIDETKYRMIVESMAKGFGSVLASTKVSRAPSMAPPAIIPSPLDQPTRARRPVPEPQPETGQDLASTLTQTMQSEIAAGIIAVETSGNSVVIRFPEEIAFPPGSDDISDDMLPLLALVTEALKDSPGTIMVSGHTDDRPIRSTEFGSNWELSTDRAVSVILRLQEIGTLDPRRLTAVGYGDTRPLVPNDSPENRARNRRVEIAIVREQPAGDPEPGA